ncbi:MAG: hypothetical protein VX335_05435 [Pseudomonadota bacterium]|nr:hypothetical protein [Pseudomonadota bacterium]
MANDTTKTVQETFKSPYLSWNSDASDFAVFAPIIWHDKIALSNTCQSGNAWKEFTNDFNMPDKPPSIKTVLRHISKSARVTEYVRTKASNYLKYIDLCTDPYLKFDQLFKPKVGQNNMHAINFLPHRTHCLQRTENIPVKNKFVINSSLETDFIATLKEKSFECCKKVDTKTVKENFKKEVLERVFANKFYVDHITDKADRLAVFYFHMMEIYKEKTNNNKKILTFSDLGSTAGYEFPIAFESASSEKLIFKRVQSDDIEKIENGEQKVELNIWKIGHGKAKSLLVEIWNNYYELSKLDDNEIMDTLINSHFPVNGFRTPSNDLLAQMIDVLGNNDCTAKEHINILIQLIVSQISFQLKDTGKRKEYLSNWWTQNYRLIKEQIVSHVENQDSHCIIRSLCNFYNNTASNYEKLYEDDITTIINNTKHIWETLTSGLYSTNPKARGVMDHLDELLCLVSTPG